MVPNLQKLGEDLRVVLLVLPDIATCVQCTAEVFDPTNRRYRYPFTNCTNCGPRFSIIESLPYDRENTTMRHFAMCETCHSEYDNPSDRRFHAQPNACPDCGPHLQLWDSEGSLVAAHHGALLATGAYLKAGQIVAVKGWGGFHLMVDARSDEAVLRLRHRKHREEKPFAIMVPSIQTVRDLCEVSSLEERALLAPESPIVLLRRCGDLVAPSVAPRNPNLGVMLPYTPLHHLLMNDLKSPVVATSGNRSDEPICIDEREVVHRLGRIADYFLVHNRPIRRHMDDLRTFSLPGADRTAQHPDRTALGVLYAMLGDAAFDGRENPLVRQILRRDIRCPKTSSAGRLFDAVASILGIRNTASFEGQAAMELEFAIDPDIHDYYPFEIHSNDPAVVNWALMIRQIRADVREHVPVSAVSAKFHNTLSEIICGVASRAGVPKIVLSGGCFQNRYLTERTVERLRQEGFTPYWHQRVPPNDGGIALGQALAGLKVLEKYQGVSQFQAG